jgi:hypothetical protein
MNKILLVGVVAILLVGCAAPQSVVPQVAAAAAVVSTTTRDRSTQPTSTPEAQATATASPTVVPSATATITPTVMPTVTPQPSQTATAAAVASARPQTAATTSGQGSGVLLPLDSRKYSAPALLTPDNNATYHVAQPVVHLAWSAAPTDLMTFGQTAGCVSDATNFRRAFESYQLVIHSLDGKQADQVQWTENSTEFDLNLTTLPRGRYSWSVNVVTLCESYVVGERNGLQHESTLERTYVAATSPTSATRIINWVP